MFIILLGVCFIIGFVALIKIIFRLAFMISGFLLFLGFCALFGALLFEPILFMILFVVAALILANMNKLRGAVN